MHGATVYMGTAYASPSVFTLAERDILHQMTIRASILQFVHACLQQQQIIGPETYSRCEGYALHAPTF